MAIHAPITGAPTRASAFDRRSMLGMLAAASLATSPELMSPLLDHRAEWNAALTAYQAAKLAHDRAWAAYKAGKNDDAHSDLVGELADAYGDAEDRLREMPAPDLPALLWKLELVLKAGEDGFIDGWSGASVQPVLKDARRLAGRA